MIQEHPRPRPIVAIDGPAGAGKSTASRRLAGRIGFVLVDTGAIYRGIALTAKERGISWDDGPALRALAERTQLSFAVGSSGEPRLRIDGVDRAAEIRSPEISAGASAISRHPEVREALLGLQRALGAEGGVVLEGRDIGTVVFPDAEVKIFLTASPEVRGRRRFEELRAQGVEADLDATIEAVRARDRADETRAVAPLRPAPDAEWLDSSAMPMDDVVEKMVAIVARKTSVERPR